ncbi:MAG: amidohydrolase family protein [Planctomycetaceae bacterium]
MYPFEDAYPYVKRVYEAFGPDRLLFGTGYPGSAREAYNRADAGREIVLIRDKMPFQQGGLREGPRPQRSRVVESRHSREASAQGLQLSSNLDADERVDHSGCCQMTAVAPEVR